MNNDQLKSLVRSGLKFAGGILIAHGASKAAAYINTEDMTGLVVTIIGFILSHRTHAEPQQPSTENQTKP